jgi:hypothetical protein
MNFLPVLQILKPLSIRKNRSIRHSDVADWSSDFEFNSIGSRDPRLGDSDVILKMYTKPLRGLSDKSNFKMYIIPKFCLNLKWQHFGIFQG